MHPFFCFVAVVPAGEETELLVGLQNEGNYFSPSIAIYFLSEANHH
jgi:hypothetical protein